MDENQSGLNINSDKINEAITALSANPELINSLMSALGKNNSADNKSDAEKTTSTPSIPEINPDMLKMLPTLMSALSPIMSSLKNSNSEEKTKTENNNITENTSEMPVAAEVSAKPEVTGSRSLISIGKHEKLLCALKPYLSNSRRQAIEHIIQISQLTDALGSINLKGDSHGT